MGIQEVKCGSQNHLLSFPAKPLNLRWRLSHAVMHSLLLTWDTAKRSFLKNSFSKVRTENLVDLFSSYPTLKLNSQMVMRSWGA